MQDHAPALAALLKDIRGENRGGILLVLHRAGQVLVKRHPGESAAHFNLHVSQGEFHRRCILEYAPSTFHDGSPPAQDALARVAALNFSVLCPDRFHSADIEAFERQVKALVGFGDCLLVILHGYHQIVMRVRASRSSEHEQRSRFS